jgi:hypothetical protein
MADILIGTFTNTPGDNRIIIPSHGLIEGDQVRFAVVTEGNALPTPLVENSFYFVSVPRGNDFKLKAQIDGPDVIIEDKGIGTDSQVWKKGEAVGPMIKYAGEGDYASVNVRLFGDGVTTEARIDLSKPPFSLNFMGFYPTDVTVVNVSPGLPKALTLNTNVLIITFDEPPPKVDLPPVSTDRPEHSLEFKVYFAYGLSV